MPSIITGVVTNGVVVPSSPLPEGARVEIRLPPVRPAVPPDLQEEFDDWERAGAGTVEMVEHLAEDMEDDEKGEIWRAHVPAAPGHAQRGERPAVVVHELASND